jgi:hypothetical protein
VEIDEDPDIAMAGSSGGIVFSTPTAESWRGNGAEGGRDGGEGCSCLYGNPCVDQYVCKDWANRMEVSKRNAS